MYAFQIRATDNSAERNSSIRRFQFYLANARKPVISHDLSSTTLTLMENVKQNTPIGKFQASTSRGSIQLQLRGKMSLHIRYLFSCTI